MEGHDGSKTERLGTTAHLLNGAEEPMPSSSLGSSAPQLALLHNFTPKAELSNKVEGNNP